MNARRSRSKSLLLATAVAAATITAAVAAPRLASATTSPTRGDSFGSNVAVSVAPARAIDVDIEPAGRQGLHAVACATGAAAGMHCYVSGG
jgi:hypothetical protein